MPCSSALGIHPVAQKLVFLHQPDFFRHPPQEQPQLFERRKRLGDVIVGAQFHGLHGGLDRPVAGHHRHLGARQSSSSPLQKFQPRHVAALPGRSGSCAWVVLRAAPSRIRRSRLAGIRSPAPRQLSCRGDGCSASSSTTSKRIRKSSLTELSPWCFPPRLSDLAPERVFPRKALRCAQSGRRFLVGDIAGDKDQSGGQFRPVLHGSRRTSRAIHPARRAHVGNDSPEVTRRQQRQASAPDPTPTTA